MTTAFYGTECHDPAEPSRTFEQRIGRCYELATYAVGFGGAPEGSLLVHGSWHGHGAPQRIGHAWVVLPSGDVWEPITCGVMPPEVFEAWARPAAEVTYTATEARQQMLAHGHFGRWHESPWP